MDAFLAAPNEFFEAHYGKHNDGDITSGENIRSFSEYVLRGTDGAGVHVCMADGVCHQQTNIFTKCRASRSKVKKSYKKFYRSRYIYAKHYVLYPSCVQVRE